MSRHETARSPHLRSSAVRCQRFVHHFAAVVVIPFLLWAHSGATLAEAAFAWARDPTGRFLYGYSTNMPSRDAAIQAAMQRCQSSGLRCNIEKAFSMACFGFASSPNGAGGFAIGRLGRQWEAEQRALVICANHRGQNCSVQQAFCDHVNENMTTALKRAESERAQLIARHATNPACNLSGKELVYSGRWCRSSGECNSFSGYIQVLGKKVLYHQGQKGTGFTLEFAKVVDITAEAPLVLKRPLTIGPNTFPRQVATASFDGSELVVRIDTIVYARNHELFPDNTAYMTSTMMDRIRITNCNACRVTEFRHESADLFRVSPPEGDRDRECQLKTIQ